jgi:hypothetical protein
VEGDTEDDLFARSEPLQLMGREVRAPAPVARSAPSASAPCARGSC